MIFGPMIDASLALDRKRNTLECWDKRPEEHEELLII
jgi:hypothetical protein